ncbi:MAG: universal stress protein [Candidatus Eremiobacteraeota bacterium]|nr:universal stress protein [Candidatus Eremiobacteraeota bacterium]
MSPFHMTVLGTIIACLIVVSVIATMYWMLHPPKSRVDEIAVAAQHELSRMVGSIIVIFAPEIESGHMMALAARVARGQKADLKAAYVIEVPFTLPPSADMPVEDRVGIEQLAAAEAIAQKFGVQCQTEIIHARTTSHAVLEMAKREQAHLLVLGSYREGKYSGAPLGRAVETIAANAKCDVLIGVEGKHGTLLVDPTEASGTGDDPANS